LYSAIKRTKEIGIRKVLGAGSKTIIWSMLKDFVYLLLGALVVALPLAYIISKRWLHEFAYQIKIGWWFFSSPTIIITVITLLTVSYHALKVAKTNPSSSLRYE
jgi:putative ABC transport system permease protein